VTSADLVTEASGTGIAVQVGHLVPEKVKVTLPTGKLNLDKLLPE
jgi:hypothetical protein